MNIQMGQQRQFDTLDVRLKQLEAIPVGQSSVTGGPVVPTDTSTSTSDSPVLAPESSCLTEPEADQSCLECGTASTEVVPA